MRSVNYLQVTSVQVAEAAGLQKGQKSQTPAAAEGHVPAPSHGLHNATTQPARVRRGSTGLKVVDNSQVCANSLEFYIEANII